MPTLDMRSWAALMLATLYTNAIPNVEAQAPTITAPFAALGTGFDTDNTAFYYPSSDSFPEVFANDGGAAAGGFRVFDSVSTNILTEVAHQKTGRSKIVAPIYGIAKKDYILTIAAPDSILRVFQSDGKTEVPRAAKYVLGDWSALCTWKSDVTDATYAFLFGKRMVKQFILTESNHTSGLLISEVQTFSIPIEGEFCAISQSGTAYFSGEDQPLYSFKAVDSLEPPTIQTIMEGTDVFGIATYTGLDSNYVILGEEAGIGFYTEGLFRIGSVGLSGVGDLELKGGLSVYQRSIGDIYPSGALATTLEGDDVSGIGIVSLDAALTAFNISKNLEYFPAAVTCKHCKPALSKACSSRGFVSSVNATSPSCACLPGTAGPTCAQTTCLKSCSFQGSCIGPNTCLCDRGFGGPDCSFRVASPAYETDANGGDGDDPAVWIHPTDSSLSRIVTTTKSGEDTGLAVFDLQGNLLQSLSAGEPNNVDVVYSFPLSSNHTTDLAFAACRSDDTLCFFSISPEGNLSTIGGGIQPTPEDYTVYGSCAYYSSRQQKHYVFVNNKEAQYLQYEVFSSANGSLTTLLVREFQGGSGGQVEGCVADSENGFLLLGEEPAGIWRYNAEPDGGDEGVQIATVGDGKLSADVEGITLIQGKTKDDGYIIVSSQGISAYLVYERAPPHAYVTTFTVGKSEDGQIDAVSNTDGIVAVGTGLIEEFGQGLFVTHDDANELPTGGTENEASFKLVGLDTILSQEELRKVDADYNPRKV